VKISVLGSGSRGNCTLLETGSTRILVDAGFGIRSLKKRLQEAELPFREIDAILITHGHWDHVSGIPSLVKKSSTNVYMNEGTREEVPVLQSLERHEIFRSGEIFSVGGFAFEAFDVPHDAASPVGFKVQCEGLRGVLTTDLGEMTPEVLSSARDCDWIVMESNHDEEMLRIGPYPWYLKNRVLGRKGHLSNRAISSFLVNDFDGCASHLFLAHLSQQNNDPELALSCAESGLEKRISQGKPCDLHIHLTHQNKPSIVLNL
jgi:phosphoribosyl 1,2-cyclic phosphodiesterase